MGNNKEKIFKSIIFKKLVNHSWTNSHKVTESEYEYIYNTLHLAYLRTNDINRLSELMLKINKMMQAEDFNSNLWLTTIKVTKAINITLMRRQLWHYYLR